VNNLYKEYLVKREILENKNNLKAKNLNNPKNKDLKMFLQTQEDCVDLSGISDTKVVQNEQDCQRVQVGERKPKEKVLSALSSPPRSPNGHTESWRTTTSGT